MFGLIHLASHLTLKAVGKIVETKDDIESKNRTIDYNKRIWRDSHGRERLIDDDRIVMIQWNTLGDQVLVDCSNGQEIINYTAEKKAKEYLEMRGTAAQTGRTAYCYRKASELMGYDKYKDPYGERWVDLFTKEKYVVRDIELSLIGKQGKIRMYMSADSGFIIRRTDGQKRKDAEHPEYAITEADETELIQKFNENQRWNKEHNKADKLFIYKYYRNGDAISDYSLEPKYEYK